MQEEEQATQSIPDGETIEYDLNIFKSSLQIDIYKPRGDIHQIFHVWIL